MPPDRGHFSQTTLVRNDQFVMQDRAFTFGPAVFCRLLGFFDIEGDIVQTHVSSPRSTAYLAALVHNNARVHEFLAFGAGARLAEYRAYFAAIGCDGSAGGGGGGGGKLPGKAAVRIFAESYCDHAAGAKLFERVVGVFCTPPNSYSGVTDPIDLICSRGGDLTMLEVLTESEMSDASKRRVAQILEQQRETLRLSLARPQVQFCLYETHSVVEAENAAMVRRAVELVNRCAHAQHVKRFKERRRLQMLAEIEGVSVEQLEKMQSVMGSTPASVAAKKKLRELEAEEAKASAGGANSARRIVVCESPGNGSPEHSDHDGGGGGGANDTDSESETLETSRSRVSKRSATATPTTITGDFGGLVRIPKTDLFETVAIPDVCAYQDNCARFAESGCFLSLIKRKRVTRLDEKYLIVMAERRGLFGDTSPKPKQSAKHHARNKEDLLKLKQQQQLLLRRQQPRRCGSEDMERLIGRLLQPTYAASRQYFVGMKSTQALLCSTRVRCVRDCGRMAETATATTKLSTGDNRTAVRMYTVWWHRTVQYIREHRVAQWEEDADGQAREALPALSLPRRCSKQRSQYRCVMNNIVFNDNKSI